MVWMLAETDVKQFFDTILLWETLFFVRILKSLQNQSDLDIV
jgi:hypothetical protein